MAATDAMMKLPISRRVQTPPSSPELPPYKQTLSSDHVRLFADLLNAAQSIQAAPATAAANQLANTEEKSGDKKTSRARASKPEFKTVNESYVPWQAQVQKLRLLPRSWNEKEYKYKIVEPPTPSGEVDELDEYVFVVRVRIGEYVMLCTIPCHWRYCNLDKKTTDPTYFVDVKSEGLRDILRTVLGDVNGICLREDKPTV